MDRRAELNVVLKPSDLVVVTTAKEVPLLKAFGQSIHVGLKITEVLGEDAADAFARFRMHSEVRRFLDPQKARKAKKDFVEIAGFTPEEVLEAVYAKERECGFTTRRRQSIR